ncbi:DUF6283 family protein [Catellatospora sp. NPDC049111]|uniref:DUF6283 family protein n=1 Tax=Catellatospora sp. NPDC049111 TaxID=3155271 RepID=UPI0034047433
MSTSPGSAGADRSHQPRGPSRGRAANAEPRLNDNRLQTVSIVAGQTITRSPERSPLRSIGPPAPRPCRSCPYRRDVPSGVWAATEYDKLERYDGDTGEQPAGVFACHQTDLDSPRVRVCSGWAGCHDGAHLLALRIAAVDGSMTADDIQATVDYCCPVPLFGSGREAAEHGRAAIDRPSATARHLISKIVNVRGDLIT